MDKIAEIYVKVVPKASRSKVIFDGDMIKIYLNSPPIDGKANTECIKLLSKILKIAKSNIIIEKGQKSRNKKIVIQGLTYSEVMKSIEEAK